MNRCGRIMRLVLAAGAVMLACGMPAGASEPDNRIVVKTADDLPRHTYTVKGNAIDIIKDDQAISALLDALVADIKADLEKYRIEDSTTMRGVYDFLMMASMFKGDLERALEYSDKAKAHEIKDEEKLMRGLSLRARIAAKSATGVGSIDDPRFIAAFKNELRTLARGLPYPTVKDRLIGVRNQAKMATRELVEMSVSAQLDPVIEANKGQVPAEVAGALVSTRFTLDVGLPLLPHIAEVYGEIIDANSGAAATGKESETDLWTPRLMALDTGAPGRPVVVAVWDSGVDTSLYPEQLWTNKQEQANGRDDDGNGFVDDLHGIAFGPDHLPTTGPLASLAGLNNDKATLMGFVAASQDMQAGIENEGVEALRAHYKALKPEQMRPFTDDMSLIGSFVHGTHVAGVAVAGNPFARIVHVSENWPYKSIPDEAPTVDEGRRWGESMKRAVAYLKKADVRVVNMSWRVGRSAFESMLEAKGAGKDPAERAELSRQIFAQLRSGLEEAIRSAPDILFIAGSGNEDNDVDFAEYIPAGLRLPNLVTVGAINHMDQFTSFTSTGKNVELYANGYRIESMVPGGRKIKFSGTSMAAPQVTNLAAKILALKPELKPADVMKLIRDHTDPVPGQPGRFIIHPRRTLSTLLN